MRINRNNYEEYFLDYIEGNLDSSLLGEFKDFLAQNPDLEKELNEFKIINLIPENLIFTEKELIKKNTGDSDIVINNTNFDYYAIARIENDLSPSQIIIFEEYLIHYPEKQKDFETLKQCKLQPDRKITFFDRDILKKKSPKVVVFKKLLPYISAAASILIIFGIYTSVKNFSDTYVDEQNEIKEEIITVDTSITEKNEIKSEEDQNNTNLEEEKVIQDPVKTKSNKPLSVTKNIIPVNKTNISDKKDTAEETNIIEIPPRENLNILQSRKPATVPIFSPGKNILARMDTHNNVTPDEENQEYLNVVQYAGSEFKKRVFKKEGKPGEKITFWDIADAGIRGIKAVTGADIELKRKYNEEGKVSNLGLSTENYELSTRVRKK